MKSYILLACALLGGCVGDGSITYTSSADPAVTNGTAYDRAELHPGGFKRVELPTSATVFRSTDAHLCRLVMEKTLGFVGHPGKPVSIDGIRKNMGCATQVRGETIAIGTFGEYDTNIEGGAQLHLRIWLPAAVQIVRRDDLEGPSSISNMAVLPDRFTKQEASAASSAGSWQVLPSVPLTRAEKKQIESAKANTEAAE